MSVGASSAAARLAPAVQLGYLWGGASAGALLLLALPARLLASMAAVRPPCPFRAITSLPCPGCGSGRALLSLSRLDLVAAFAWNPLVTSGAVAFLAGGLAALAAALSGRGVPAVRLSPGWVRVAAVAAVALSWGWLLADGR